MIEQPLMLFTFLRDKQDASRVRAAILVPVCIPMRRHFAALRRAAENVSLR